MRVMRAEEAFKQVEELKQYHGPLNARVTKTTRRDGFIIDHVVFARDIVNPQICSFDDLIGIVELLGFCEVSDVAGVDHESRLSNHSS